MPLPPILGFAAAYAVMVFSSALGASPALSLALMLLVYSALSAAPGDVISSLTALTSWGEARLFLLTFLSLMLAGAMREAGLLEALVEGASGVGCRFSLFAVPALVGLVPMPGGALVSAVAMESRYREAGLSPEEATFVNHWFRHVWVPCWPLFQSVLIASSVLNVDPVVLASRSWVVTASFLAAGLAVSAPILARASCTPGGSPLKLLAGAWPFALVAVLVFAFKLGLESALALAVSAVVLASRLDARRLASALRFASNPRAYAVLLEALLLKNLLEATGAPESVAELSSGLPPAAVALLVPFAVGTCAGGESLSVATGLPLVKSIVVGAQGVEWPLALKAYAASLLGAMLSPAHLCLALTLEHFRARVGKVLALVGLAVLLACIPFVLL